jgi:two-component system OmpR family sensor kinase
VKFHNRLTVALLGVTASTMLASFATVYVLVRRDELHDLDMALRAQAEAVSHQTTLEGDARVPEKPGAAQARYAALYDRHGQVTTYSRAFAEHPPPALKALGVEPPVDEAGASVDLVVPERKLRGVVIATEHGFLLYAVSRRSIDEDMLFLARSLAALFLGALAMTAFIARWLGRRLARDVNTIAGVARIVSTGDLSARVGPDAAIGSEETRSLAHDLDGMIGQLEKLMSAQRTFISHAAHELRSPLATLRGELQLALRRERSADEYRVAVQQALLDVEELGQLTEDLLTLARVQQVPLETRAGAIEVRSLIADATRMAHGRAEAHEVRITEPSGEALHVRLTGVRSDLARALRNLIDNATAHSPKGASVRVVARSGSDTTVDIAVEDEGSGIAEEDVDRIFTPFWRGSAEEGGEAGAGLGLSIAREIARKHGGDILLQRKNGEDAGACFVLRMPVSATDGSRA